MYKQLSRLYCITKTKIKVFPNEAVINNLQQQIYKPRKHPGINTVKTVKLPDSIVTSIENVIIDHPLKSLKADSITMCRHLLNRVPQMDQEQINTTKQNLYETVVNQSSDTVEITTEQDMKQFKRRVNDRVLYLLKKKVYHWEPMLYDAHKCLVYLIGRAPPEYAVLVKVLNEISMRDGGFRPRSLFDFGSGVGTATWAANLYWKSTLFEYFNVDVSSFMNDLAQLIINGGRVNSQSISRGIFYRQFLPSNNNTYDLVISAYSLLELPSFETRMETILKLWNMTEKYLVLVEYGTNAGFKVINECRDFILQLKEVDGNEFNEAHVFSPCPHNFTCPRIHTDNTPCNFSVKYETLPLGEKSSFDHELYSYVILKKGKRDDSNPQWPRVVRETLVRSKHCICRVCSANGKLEELIFSTAKHGKATYHCARSTKWGDYLPITTETVEMDLPDDKSFNKNTEND